MGSEPQNCLCVWEFILRKSAYTEGCDAEGMEVMKEVDSWVPVPEVHPPLPR